MNLINLNLMIRMGNQHPEIEKMIGKIRAEVDRHPEEEQLT